MTQNRNGTPRDPNQPVKAYTQPLFWLVVGIPAATVVAGFVTLWIANNGADVPVSSDYVKKGLNVTPDTHLEDRARALGIRGTLSATQADELLTIRVRLLGSPDAKAAGQDSPDIAATKAGTEGEAAVTAEAESRASASGSASSSASKAGAGIAKDRAADTAPAGAPATPAPRRLRLAHPSDPNSDITLHLLPDGQGQWQARQPVTWTPGTRWHVSIEGDDWRLTLPRLQALEELDGLGFDSQPH